MSIRTELAKIIRGKTPDPISQVVPGKDEQNPHERQGWYDKTTRRVKTKRWMDKYQRGGLYAEGIDAYHLFALSKKWTFECEPGAEGLKDLVQAWADQPEVDLDTIMKDGILSSILTGDGYQEIVLTKDTASIWGVVTRDPGTFEKVVDKYGRVEEYIQYVPKGYSEEEIKLPADSIINLVLFRKPGGIYGLSIWERAEDDIERDCDVVESATKAIHRHGTPKQHWTAGTDENPASVADIKNIEKNIEVIGPKTDFATSHDIKINMLDTQGIPNVDVYSNVTLRRAATSLGVPEEALGLGAGSTEATANVRLRLWYDKITTIQEIVSRTYTRELVDRITGQPGKVWIQFNQMNMSEFAQMATAISTLRRGEPDPDAICPAEWARERLGIPEDTIKKEWDAGTKDDDIAEVEET